MMNRYEFEETLKSPIAFWGGKTEEEVRALLGDEVAAMVHYDQCNPHHCYDLFLHALHATEHVAKQENFLLSVAAFFHDIGKPSVAAWKNGRKTFYGHASKSVKIATPILTKLGYSEAEIWTICFFIGHHDDFIQWVLPEEKADSDNKYMVSITERNLQKHRKKWEKKEQKAIDTMDWKNLLRLCVADVSSQAEIVIIDGREVNSKEKKLARLEKIAAFL